MQVWRISIVKLNVGYDDLYSNVKLNKQSMYDDKFKSIGNSISLPDSAKLFADGVSYINTSQWVFAYAVFTNLYQNSNKESVAIRYNLALCYYFTKAYQKAALVLTEALTKLAVPSISRQAPENLSNEILSHELENNQYRLALNETAVELNAGIVKLRIRRLLVDVQLALENWEEVIRLAALSEMVKCKNVQEALAISKSKMNR